VAARLAGESLLTSDGLALPLRRFLPKGEVAAVVVALHGMNDYSNAFAETGTYLAERGIATYAYDQRGFGANAVVGVWPGTPHLAADLLAAVGAVRAAHPDLPVHVLGESMGGAVAMVAATSAAGLPVRSLILSAPAVWGWDSLNPFYRAVLWVVSRLAPGARFTADGLNVLPSDNIEMLRALGRDPLFIKETRADAIYGIIELMTLAAASARRQYLPTLVLYGRRDEVIPKAPTWTMLGRLASPHRVAVYREGYHMLLRDLGAARVRADVAAWVLDPGAALPSGEDRDWQGFFTGARP
jgi:alpha-beta hydrolase superfamily lysophospholipase